MAEPPTTATVQTMIDTAVASAPYFGAAQGASPAHALPSADFFPVRLNA